MKFMRFCLTAYFCLLAGAAVCAQSAPQLAVLETRLEAQGLLKPEEARHLTDELRRQALTALPGYSILTRENLQALLPVGQSLEDIGASTANLVELGRQIAADYVAQGRVGAFGKQQGLTVELYETRGGTLLASFTAEQPDAEGLLVSIRAQAAGLFGKAANRPPEPAAPEAVGTVVTVAWSDGPGSVLFDGRLACGNQTLCRQELAVGAHWVSAGRDGFRDTTFRIVVPQGGNRYTLALQPQIGVLTVRASDSASGNALEAELWVDGRRVGRTPWSGPVAVAAQEIVVRAAGYADAVVRMRPQDGQKAAVALLLARVRPAVQQRMVAIPAGCFVMGSSAYDNEKPAHGVCVGAFRLDNTEVTQAAFLRVRGDNPSQFANCGAECPVERVRWSEAQAYCLALGKRLPTEAEWEYAARAGTATEWPCGTQDSCLERSAWYGANSGGHPHPVGQKDPNAWGLYDMAGNAWEWTADWYREPYEAGGAQDPTGPADGTFKVLRGGSWFALPALLRLAGRSASMPEQPGNGGQGFRCAASVP